MTDYTAILDTQVDPDAPITSGLGYQLRDNPIAIAEGALGAPKIASKTLAGSGLTVTFTDLDDFSGISIRGGHEGAGAISLAHSTDGVTFTGSVNITGAVGVGNNHSYFEVFFDFATGNFKSIYSSGGSSVAVGALSGTSVGSSLDITDVRISGSGGNVAVFAMPQGGESTT